MLKAMSWASEVGPQGAGVAAPIFWLVAVLGPRFLNMRVVCFITKTQTLSENGICKLETIEHLCYLWTCNCQQETWLTLHTSLSFRSGFRVIKTKNRLLRAKYHNKKNKNIFDDAFILEGHPNVIPVKFYQIGPSVTPWPSCTIIQLTLLGDYQRIFPMKIGQNPVSIFRGVDV